ncbi:helix-turn-helix domain-containing protein [Streptomyces sp. LUP30]
MLADRIGCSPATVSRLERRTRIAVPAVQQPAKVVKDCGDVHVLVRPNPN